MNARIGHVVDARDTRPVFGITYRRFQDVRSSHVQIQAADFTGATAALTKHVGSTQYAVIAAYIEQPLVRR